MWRGGIENTWNSLTQSMGKYWHRGMTGLDNTSSYVVSLLFDMMCVFPVFFHFFWWNWRGFEIEKYECNILNMSFKRILQRMEIWLT